jgi:hypothetical protein
MFFITVSGAMAGSITVFDEPTGIYDTVYADLAVAGTTGRAFVQVYMVDAAYYNACWGDQAVMRGIGNDDCLINTINVAVPGLEYHQNQNSFTYNGTPVNENDLVTNLYEQRVDTGIRINSVRYAQVTLQTP